MPEHAFIWSSWHQDTILLLSHTHCNGWTNKQPDKARCWALLAQSEPARSWHRLLPNGRTSAASWHSHSPWLQSDNKCQTQKIRHKAAWCMKSARHAVLHHGLCFGHSMQLLWQAFACVKFIQFMSQRSNLLYCKLAWQQHCLHNKYVFIHPCVYNLAVSCQFEIWKFTWSNCCSLIVLQVTQNADCLHCLALPPSQQTSHNRTSSC